MLDRQGNVSLSSTCCDMCVKNANCGGWVWCPKCPLNLPRMGPDTANCFLIHGPITATRSANRTSGIVRGSIAPSHSCPIKSTHGVTFNELAKLHAMAYSCAHSSHSPLTDSPLLGGLLAGCRQLER